MAHHSLSLPAGFQVAVIVLLVGETQPTALTEAGRLAGVTPHVGHQQQRGTEPLPTLGTLQHPLVSAGVLLQLLRGVEPLAALQTPDLVGFLVGLLVAPAARVLFVLQEVLLTEELPQTRHTVEALRLALVFAVQLGQPVVAAAADAGVRQQAQVREAVLQERILLGEGLGAVRALKAAGARALLVAGQRLWGAEIAPAYVARDIRHALVKLDVVLTVLQGGEHALAQVALVKLLLQVRPGQVLLQLLLRAEARQTDAAPLPLHLGPGVFAQVDSVVVYLTEALPALGAAVRSRSCVQVHVVLELELGGELEITDTAAIVPQITWIWREFFLKRSRVSQLK